MSSRVHIVAVAGPPGCGKSSLVNSVAATLGHAAVLEFDEFETLTTVPAESMAAWQAEGGSFSALQVPGLAGTLEALKRGEAVRAPRSGRRIAPRPLILFEMPLGRAYPPTRSLIDALAWIELPPEVALARALIAICSAPQKPPHAWLVRYLEDYVRFTRIALAQQREQVLPGADITLDGQCPLAELSNIFLEWVRGIEESH